MDSTSEQLRFASIPGCTIRADFQGGGLSSDFGPLLHRPFDADAALASGSTISRFEHAVSRKDIYRVSEALVEQFIAGYASPLFGEAEAMRWR